MRRGIRILRMLAAMAAALILLLPASPHALAQEAFVISHYGVDVTAHEDNTYAVTETLDVNFTEARHGIYRDIPLRFGSGRVSVTGITVEGAAYTVYRNPSSLRIQIGDADQSVIGPQTYTIRYTLNMGRDQAEGYDGLYLNLIGAYWDTSVDSADMTLRMPEDFEPGQVSLYRGREGETGTSGLQWQLEGGVLTARITQPLSAMEGVSVLIELPEGTFTGDADAFDFIRWIAVLLAVLTVGGALALWLLLGRDEPLSPVVEFHPPEGLNPAQASYVLDEKVDNEDVAAMFIYWASHGHMTLEETGKRDFALYKVSDLDAGHTQEEKDAFGRLWQLGRDNRVESEDLKNVYYQTVNSFKSRTAKPFTDRKVKRLYDARSQRASLLVVFMGGLCFWTLCLLSVWTDTFDAVTAIVMAFMLVIPYGLVAAGWFKLQRVWRRTSSLLRILGAAGMLLITVAAVLVTNVIFEDGLMPLERNSLLAASLAAILLKPFVRRRTPWGHSLTERVLGFRQFMMEAERDRIERLVDENPAYFFDMLPYSISLGVTRKWTRKFEGLIEEPPQWYRSSYTGHFTALYFVDSLSRTTGAMQAAATSQPSSSGGGGGGFSGGGGVGGGGGGGGGGSW